VLSALAATSLFGAADEWHQQFIPGRSQDVADWLADTLGAGIGVLTAAALRSRREPLA
jgi:VanZ family protein